MWGRIIAKLGHVSLSRFMLSYCHFSEAVLIHVIGFTNDIGVTAAKGEEHPFFSPPSTPVSCLFHSLNSPQTQPTLTHFFFPLCLTLSYACLMAFSERCWQVGVPHSLDSHRLQRCTYEACQSPRQPKVISNTLKPCHSIRPCPGAQSVTSSLVG